MYQNPIKITKLFLIETPGYQDQYHRTYTTYLDGVGLQQVQQATNYGQSISAEALAGVSGSVLQLSQAGHSVDMVNGWGTNRFRFLMAVEQNTIQGGRFIQYLQGYTDHLGVSHGGALDQRMRFFINSVTQTRTVAHHTPMGTKYVPTAHAADHILTRPKMGYGMNGLGVSNSSHLMRPMDALNTISLRQIDNHFADHAHEFIDGRTSFVGDSVHKSRRKNGNTPEYLSRVMNAYRNAHDPEDVFSDEATRMTKAAGTVQENTVAGDPFLGLLMRETEFREGQSISLGELTALCPELPHVMQVVPLRQAPTFSQSMGASAEYWTSSDATAQIAARLSNAVPAIMLDLMLTRLGFVVHNRTLDNQPDFKFMVMNSFGGEDLDLTPYAMRFQHRFLTECFMDITEQGRLDVALEIMIDVLGDSVIRVSHLGGPMTDYVTPTFTDALLAPVWADSNRQLHSLALDIDMICSHLDTAATPPKTAIQQTIVDSTTQPPQVWTPQGGHMKV